MPPTTAPRLLVVGGGATGLAAAWEAIRRGADVTVVEAGDRFGGKVWTERVDGFVIDHGPDAFITYKRAALDLVGELGLTERLVQMLGARDVQLRAGGRLHPIPAGMGMVLPTRVGPFLTTRTLTWRHKLRAAADLALPRRLGAEDVAVGAFLRARLGDGVVDRFADPMVGGVFGSRVDELSLDAALPMLRESEAEHRSMILASLAQGRAARRRGGVTRGVGSPFRSLDDGLGVLVDALVGALREEGADVRAGRAAATLRRETGGTRVAFGDGTEERYAGVVLATGPAAAADLLEPEVPEGARALRGIPLASTTVVNLGYAAAAFPTPPTFQGWLESGEAPASAVTITSAKWPGRAPDGAVLIRALVPDKVGPAATLDDDALVTAVRAHLGEVLGVRGEPDLVRVARWRGVMPQYTVGHVERVAALEAALEDHPTWRVAGAALRGVGLPDCIASGRAAAAAVLEAADPDR